METNWCKIAIFELTIFFCLMKRDNKEGRMSRLFLHGLTIRRLLLIKCGHTARGPPGSLPRSAKTIFFVNLANQFRDTEKITRAWTLTVFFSRCC